MPLDPSMSWNVTPREAIALQRELATRVVPRDETGTVRTIGGVDVGFEGADNQIARAAIVVLRLADLVLLDCAVARRPVRFPYIPGLLSFREIPVILRALEKLKQTPDVIVVDGHGLAHPRRIGIASHLGVVAQLPTVGCAKSILCGRADDPPNTKGAWAPLLDDGETIGAALRTKANTKPVYVSIGHKVSLDRAVELVLRGCTHYRLPETTRYAHRAADGQSIWPAQSKRNGRSIDGK